MSANIRTSNRGIIEIIQVFLLFYYLFKFLTTSASFFLLYWKENCDKWAVCVMSRKFLNWWFSAKFCQLPGVLSSGVWHNFRFNLNFHVGDCLAWQQGRFFLLLAWWCVHQVFLFLWQFIKMHSNYLFNNIFLL